MSRSGKIRLVFGDGPHDFFLSIDGLEELQEKTGFGPEELYRRLGDGTWRSPRCIREPLRIGLVGGGMSSIDALVLVERYAGPGALIEVKTTAQAVIAASLIGAPDEDDPPGEPEAGTQTPLAPASPTASGASPSSTASAE
jgi:hypothetical protein